MKIWRFYLIVAFVNCGVLAGIGMAFRPGEAIHSSFLFLQLLPCLLAFVVRPDSTVSADFRRLITFVTLLVIATALGVGTLEASIGSGILDAFHLGFLWVSLGVPITLVALFLERARHQKGQL